ncbi:MAG: STAS domain-containing protein [Selenomonadaceae bacterium]|nr:STAS domain-containing protein [Selenomonadaceae bacterium]
MEVKKELQGTTLTVQISGRLDASNAAELTKELNTSLNGVKDLILDFNGLEYVASAGLRVLLTAQKRMNKQGSMKIRNVSDTVMEVLEMTGFADLMNIEQ